MSHEDEGWPGERRRQPPPLPTTYQPAPAPEGAWLGLALVCGCSGALVGAALVALAWWLT